MSNARKLHAAAFMGKDGCEHQEFIQPVTVTPGEAQGSVEIRIGDCFIHFPSVDALLTSLQEATATQPDARSRSGMLGMSIASLIAGVPLIA